MKKLLAGIFMLTLALSLAACDTAKETSEPIGTDRKLKIGCTQSMNFETDFFENMSPEAKKRMESIEIVSFDTFSERPLALESGKIDIFAAPIESAKYMISKNSEFKIIPVPTSRRYYKMAINVDDTALFDEINAAIAALKADGTMDKLIKKQIDDVLAGTTPEAIEMPKYDGEGFTVAVTGDFPPMDYVGADGKPAGFNTALLAAISDYLKKPIQIVSVNAGARQITLTSKKADVIFTTVTFSENFTNDKVLLSDSYYNDITAYITKDLPVAEIKEFFGLE